MTATKLIPGCQMCASLYLAGTLQVGLTKLWGAAVDASLREGSQVGKPMASGTHLSSRNQCNRRVERFKSLLNELQTPTQGFGRKQISEMLWLNRSLKRSLSPGTWLKIMAKWQLLKKKPCVLGDKPLWSSPGGILHLLNLFGYRIGEDNSSS